MGKLAKFNHFFAMTALLLCLSGCASIISDTQSTTYMETDPEKARCELHGQDFVRVVSTPNSISLPAKSAPLTVACTAPGYKRTTATLDTKVDGWIWGNILFGGVIGGVVDLARGAGDKYPPKITIILEPEQFRTLADRDAWFDQRKSEIETKWLPVVNKAKAQCKNTQTSGVGSDNKERCEHEVAEVQAKEKTELDLNEKKRQEAKVAESQQAAAAPAAPTAKVE